MTVLPPPLESIKSPTPTDPSTPVPIVRYRVDEIKDFYSKELNNQRTIWVYVPEGTSLPDGTRLKVLYFNDGQDLALMGMAKILARLVNGGKIEPIIVVGIAASDDRNNEYGINGTINQLGMGTHSKQYEQFILQEVMPFIAEHYPILAGSQNTAIAGWSLGGLNAFDLAWRHPDLFGWVGAFSGSFWWRTDNSSSEAAQASRVAQNMVETGAFHPSQHFWFSAGTLEEMDDRDHNGVIDVIQDTTELIDALVIKGFTNDQDIRFVQIQGGRHDKVSWLGVLPDFLEWTFGK